MRGMRGKLLMIIGDRDSGAPIIEFNMENEHEKEFFYRMQEFLLNKGLSITICLEKNCQKGEQS